MMDFSKISLVLEKDGKIVYSSQDSGLRPLFDCIVKCKGRITGVTLHDKVVGLGAARLVTYSKIAGTVITPLASKPAVEHLTGNCIEITAGKIVENILTKDRSDTCPMEKKAKDMDDSMFFTELQRLFD